MAGTEICCRGEERAEIVHTMAGERRHFDFLNSLSALYIASWASGLDENSSSCGDIRENRRSSVIKKKKIN
jgi:hypothetical protein